MAVGLHRNGYHAYTRNEPYGVVGIITPCNGPMNQLSRGLARH
jgi:aldehyde dehydrogenase (NAD+)